jgi:hypothetical protein
MITTRVSRNDPCPCGSGKKFKHCCVLKGRPLSTAVAIRSLGKPTLKRLFDVVPLRPSSKAQMSEAYPERQEGWKELHLDAPLRDGTALHIILLHSDEWMWKQRVSVGYVLDLNLPQISYQGQALLTVAQPAECTGASEGQLQAVFHRDADGDSGLLVLGARRNRIARSFGDRCGNLRLVSLELIERRGHLARRVNIEMLRSLEWIREHKAAIGASIFLDEPKEAIQGFATVRAIRSCPPRERWLEKMQIGVYKPWPCRVGDLKIGSECKPIGVTPLHPFWCPDKNAWVSAGRLEPGDHVSTSRGLSVVEWYVMREVPEEAVYNLEVEGDHVYGVGESGVLVHNSSAPVPGMDYGCENKAGGGRLDPCESGLLATKLGGCKTDYQAHHLIACSVRNSVALQRAAQLGFDINGMKNGWCLPSLVPEAKATGLPLHCGRHVSGAGCDPNYFTCVKSLLVGLDADYSSGRVTDCDLCAKVASVAGKIRSALAAHQIWLQKADPNKGTTWQCPTYN